MTRREETALFVESSVRRFFQNLEFRLSPALAHRGVIGGLATLLQPHGVALMFKSGRSQSQPGADFPEFNKAGREAGLKENLILIQIDLFPGEPQQ